MGPESLPTAHWPRSLRAQPPLSHISSATLAPHMLSHPCPTHTQPPLSRTCSPGATLAGDVPHARGSRLETLLHTVLRGRVAQATGECQGTAAMPSPSPLECGSGQPLEGLRSDRQGLGPAAKNPPPRVHSERPSESQPRSRQTLRWQRAHKAGYRCPVINLSRHPSRSVRVTASLQANAASAAGPQGTINTAGCNRPCRCPLFTADGHAPTAR